jgi:hypothetical protein
MEPARFKRTALHLAGLCAVWLVYAVLWKTAPYAALDTPSYVEVVQDLRHLELSQVHQRTPGLPFLLLITGADKAPTRLFYFVSLGLHFAAVAMLAYLLDSLGIALWAVRLFLVLACLPPFVEWAGELGTETLSEFLVIATFACAITWVRTRGDLWIAAACLLGTSAAMTRPTFQALLVVIALGTLLCSWFGLLHISFRQRIAVVVAAGVSAGAQMSYAAANYAKFGYLGTNSIGAYALSTKVADVVEFLPDRYAAVREIWRHHRDQLLIDPRYDHTGQNFIFRAMPELVNLYGGDQLAAVTDIQRLSVYLIVHKPMSYLNASLKAIAGYWMPTDGRLSNSTPAWRLIWAVFELTVVGLFFLQAIALTGAAVFSLPQWLNCREERDKSWNPNPLAACAYVFASLIIWYTMLVSCFLAIGLARYRVPTDLLILFSTLIGFQIWTDLARRPLEFMAAPGASQDVLRARQVQARKLDAGWMSAGST